MAGRFSRELGQVRELAGRLTLGLVAWWRGRRAWARWSLGMLAAAALAWWRCLPDLLFDVPYATTIEARDGSLLSARIADDGQWRFAPGDSLDPRYRTCVVVYEDEWFDWHPGVNPVSFGRALRQNLRAGRVVSGGSTLTMQAVRLMRRGHGRTISEKLVELIWATRLEAGYTKDEILRLYAAHAPYGGNVVGLEAAAWRYYGRGPTHFSWAEAAALAVLPNAPGVIYPGRSDAAFRAKRDALLDKLVRLGYLEGEEAELAKLEPLPGKPYGLPDWAPALALGGAPFRADGTQGTQGTQGIATGAQRGRAQTGGTRGDEGDQARRRTTVDGELQRRVLRLVEGQRQRNAGNGVHNACALVASVATGEVLAYVGNAEEAGAAHANRVDVLQAPRSSGSVLKPFLYATLLDAGRLTPRTLLPDIPTLIGGYAPQNFDHGFDGAVRAGEALTRSLNIPHVRLLREYGVAPMLERLRRTGFAHLTRPAEEYGLSLILGGGEVTAWEVAGAYRALAHTVLTYTAPATARQYRAASWSGLHLTATAAERAGRTARRADGTLPTHYSAGAAYVTLETLTQLERPGDLAAWRSFGGSRRVAWKTGTSFGFRDAWAVGVTPEYVVVVWTGNADGEGRPGLTGSAVAAPLLFEVFDQLPATTWFERPVGDLRGISVCAASGLGAGQACPEVSTALLPAVAPGLDVCPWHHAIVVDVDGRRVDSECAVLAEAQATTAFVLPPSWALYYRSRTPSYVGMPPWAPGCAPADERAMAMVYPRGGRLLQLPRDLSGTRQAAVFEVAHQELGAALTWYLDGAYVGTTRGPHQRPLLPRPGAHELVVEDGAGRVLRYGFEVGAW